MRKSNINSVYSAKNFKRTENLELRTYLPKTHVLKTTGFTLVELIVVIVILAILATIAFLSFSSQSASARDSTRLSDLSNIAKGLSVFNATSGTLPKPDSYITLTASGTAIGFQGKAGSSVLGMIKMNADGGKDPLEKSYYTYATNSNQSKFQILGFLEDGSNTALSFMPISFAADYSKRFTITRGDNIGILLSSGTLDPVENKLTTSFTGVDLLSQVFTGASSYSMAGELSNSTAPTIPESCNAWIKNYPSLVGKDGTYRIKLPNSSSIINTYCDMTTDKGGWTRINSNFATINGFSGKTIESLANDTFSGGNNGQGCVGTGYNILVNNLKLTNYTNLRYDLERTSTILQCSYLKQNVSPMTALSLSPTYKTFYFDNGIYNPYTSKWNSGAGVCEWYSLASESTKWDNGSGTILNDTAYKTWRTIWGTDIMTDKSSFYYTTLCSSSADNGVFKMQFYIK